MKVKNDMRYVNAVFNQLENYLEERKSQGRRKEHNPGHQYADPQCDRRSGRDRRRSALSSLLNN